MKDRRQLDANLTPLRIRNWDRWQSYRSDRGTPPWIKIHRCVMRNPDWVSLSDAQRGQLVAIWLLAADRDGLVPASPAVLKKLCYMDSEPDLKLFMDKRFIEPDANLTPERRQHDRPEEETEEDKDIVQTNGHAAGEAEEGKPRKIEKLDPHFLEFYSAYPRRQSKQDALKAYSQITKAGVSHETIMRGLDRAKRDDRRFREQQFTPLPASWLRAGGFEDEAGDAQDWKKAVFS